MRISQVKIFTVIVTLLLIVGCGGGNGSKGTSSSESLLPSEVSISMNGLKFTSTSKVEVEENQKNAIDVNANTTSGKILTYSIFGTDVDSFNIEEDTGLVTFKEVPDYEKKTSYNFTVKVSDDNAELSQDITITIKNINDTKPTIISSSTKIIKEKEKLAIDIDATDEDEDGHTLTYSISGIDAKSFTIDSSTGVVTFIEAPDYEKKKEYILIAKVNDGINETSQDITITIRDPKINNNAPVFTSSMTETVEENQKEAMTLTATDADGHTLTYSISGTDATSFTIDSSTGVVTFIEAPDYEKKKEYIFIAKVSDGIEEVTQTITIAIINVNDSAPNITSSSTATVAENQLFAIDVTATDADGDTLIYSISDGDADSFDINSSTGVVTFKNAPDYEAKTSYSFTVTVSDGNDATENATQAIMISISNVSDSAPIIHPPFTAEVKENQFSAIEVNATDPDGDTLTYAIDNTNDFTISDAGVVTFNTVPDFESGKISYNPTVEVSDGTNKVSQAITISIININDNVPTFTSDTNATVEENQLSAIDIDATDADGDTLLYAISGADTDSFDINSSTGVVTFKTEPDYETKTSYNFTATVNDGTHDVNQSITITIIDDISD